MSDNLSRRQTDLLHECLSDVVEFSTVHCELNDAPSHLCLLCDRMYKSKKSLNRHLKSKRGCSALSGEAGRKSRRGALPTSGDCKDDEAKSRRTQRRNELQQHHVADVTTADFAQLQADGSGFSCAYTNCNYKSKYRSNVKRHHDKTHFSVDFSCCFCDKLFAKQCELKGHVLMHASQWTGEQVDAPGVSYDVSTQRPTAAKKPSRGKAECSQPPEMLALVSTVLAHADTNLSHQPADQSVSFQGHSATTRPK